MKCVVCAERKGKRQCPALEGMICPPCCGSRRGGETPCPSSCPYLITGEAYQQDRLEIKELKSRVEEYRDIEIPKQDLDILLGIEFIIQKYYRKYPRMVDSDIQEALEIVVRNIKTRDSGLIYRQRSDKIFLQEMIDEIEKFLDQIILKERRLNLSQAINYLNKILGSVILHRSRRKGSCAYLEFVGSFFKKAGLKETREGRPRSAPPSGVWNRA